MSHLTRGKTKISDLFVLKKVAKSMGLKVREDKRAYQSHYNEDVPCEFVIEDGWGGSLGIQEEAKGEYRVVMDNYNNSICKVAGPDGRNLTREYTVEAYRSKVALMGGVVENEVKAEDGWIEIDAFVAV